MTEQEAIKKHLEECRHRIEIIKGFLKAGKGINEDIVKDGGNTITILKTAITALEEIRQYRELGTVEECREAVEKQIPKKAVISEKQDIRYVAKYDCPSCGGSFTGKIADYCYHCGQHIDWSE